MTDHSIDQSRPALSADLAVEAIDITFLIYNACQLGHPPSFDHLRGMISVSTVAVRQSFTWSDVNTSMSPARG
jgi:hypothetical protein